MMFVKAVYFLDINKVFDLKLASKVTAIRKEVSPLGISKME